MMGTIIMAYWAVLNAILIAAVAIKDKESKKKQDGVCKKILNYINDGYKKIWKSCKKIVKYLIGLVGISIIVFPILQILSVDRSQKMEVGIRWIAAYVITYIVCGIITTMLINAQESFEEIKNEPICLSMNISYVIMGFNIVMMIMCGKVEVNKYFEIVCMVVIGASICISYILSMQVVFSLIKNPFVLSEGEHNEKDIKTIVKESMIVLVMVVMELYAGCLCIYEFVENSYTFINIPGVIPINEKFQLLYYTVISFTTIGYGDISPIHYSSMVMSAVISVTSVICLVGLLNAIMGAIPKRGKKRIHNKK